MAMQVKANNATRVRNRVLGIFVALAVIIFVSVLTAISAAETKKTITVCRIKADAPISANSMITEDMIEAYDMYYKEFEQYGTKDMGDGTKRSVIVRWADKDLVVNKRFAAYYLRENTILFWDSTIKDQTRKNSYLYNMTGELLNIDMTTTGDFGDMVVPGDSLNVRAVYTMTYYNLPTKEAYKLKKDEGGDIGGVERTVNELLFSEVKILDMLNTNGQSVFDIYYQYIAMSKAQQQAALADSGFLQSVQPASILLEVTSEEVERFMEVNAAGAQYQITLLPRTGSSAMTESLSEIQTALSGIADLKKDN